MLGRSSLSQAKHPTPLTPSALQAYRTKPKPSNSSFKGSPDLDPLKQPQSHNPT